MTKKDISILDYQVRQKELERRIEELQRSQKELKESHDKYRDMYDLAPVNYFSFNKNGIIIDVNRSGEEKLGRERNYLIMKPFSLFICPDSKKIFYLHLNRVFKSGVLETCELKLINNKGVKFYIQLESISSGGGNDIFCRTVSRDITDRKMAEEAIRNTLIYTTSLIDSIREPLVILDENMRLKKANLAFYNTFKININENKDKLFYELGNGEWNIPDLRELLETIIPMNIKSRDFEIEKEFLNIGQKSILINASEHKLSDTKMILLTIKDITELKKMEGLRLENERLISARKARSEFLTIMSHELRTPLTSVIGYSILLQEKSAGELNEEQRLFVDNVLRSSKHLLDLINNFLELARTETGKQKMVFEEISVSAALNEILEMINENAKAKNINLTKEFDPEIYSIKVDGRAFKQIIFNLLSNAIKFSKRSGGIVTISTKKENDMIKISVEDNGIGIKKNDLPKLFHMFEQLDSGISRKYEGTGLGLAITKQLIELHGGKIWVESKYGKGSKFMLYLPLEAKVPKI
ncbi:MAG: PAS domain-containing sensor histidine kinase [Candidatus Methanoperedens sp.]|nr:PAS domain-containing sensor histidine kinase [Candidatus Methanoperedens sp.]